LKHFLLCLALLSFVVDVPAQKINRKELVQRHNVVVTKADSLSSLTVGNGRFAFTVDVTGLQSFPGQYAKGVSLGTQSEWGWHSFIDTAGYKIEEAQKTYHLNRRDVTYTVQWNAPERNKAASNWFRQNPHRLQLGNLGLVITKENGQPASLPDIKNINQQLDLWTGEIVSRFTVDGIPVEVRTVAHGDDDVIAARINSSLVAKGRLTVSLQFPYPTGAWTDEGVNYTQTERHSSRIVTQQPSGALLEHKLDTTAYYVGFSWKGNGKIKGTGVHSFSLAPAPGDKTFSFSARFSHKEKGALPSFETVRASSSKGWNAFWQSGAVVDFKGSTDPRAKELERRIILSQYLMKAQEAGEFPPQETGLTYNSWFGKPHLEMTWWHAAHWGPWGRIQYTEKLLAWYASVANKARSIAARQGYEGVRWQKMTDNRGDETPSSVGALLIWQQPHYIYFAEQCYRHYKNAHTLNRYKDLVFATADFMASFARYDSAKKKYVLGKGLIPAQERFKAEETFNPAYELVYWHWALQVAQEWRKRLGLPPNEKWNAVIKNLSPLPVQDEKYLFAESALDSYTNPEYRTDHPSVLAAFGVLPATGQVKNKVMQNTFNWIWKYWTWQDTWGWDFPMTAMTAVRLGDPEKAIEALLMNIRTNTYLVNGHNYQDERLRIYMPGNGGLLAAIALMVGGYDGSGPMPGIPKNGQWKVRHEGFKKMP
jgi:hypothetical protein